jgi:death-on-curing protein
VSVVVYLTVDQVLAFHEQALELFGGIEGLRSEHLLASAVFQPQQSAFIEDAYPTIAEKAATYGFSIAENQPFVDGNKRTAAAAMLVFLDLNGYEFDQTDDEIAEMFEGLSNRAVDQADFTAWVIKHSAAEIPPP